MTNADVSQLVGAVIGAIVAIVVATLIRLSKSADL
jgi:hypothetical protein